MASEQSISVSTTSQSRAASQRLRRWFWPLVALLAFLGIAWYADHSVNRTLRRDIEKSLTTILKADVNAMTVWLEGQRTVLAAMANQPSVREMLISLLQQAEQASDVELAALASAKSLHQELQPLLHSQQLATLFVTDQTGRLIADTTNQLLGIRLPAEYSPHFEQILGGKTIVIPPHKSLFAIPDHQGATRTAVPIILIAGPIPCKQGGSKRG